MEIRCGLSWQRRRGYTDTYLEQMRTMGVEEYVEIYQGALDRYNLR